MRISDGDTNVSTPPLYDKTSKILEYKNQNPIWNDNSFFKAELNDDLFGEAEVVLDIWHDNENILFKWVYNNTGLNTNLSIFFKL